MLALCLIGLAAMIIMWSTTEIQTTTKACLYVISPALALVSVVVSIWWLVQVFRNQEFGGRVLLDFDSFLHLCLQFKGRKNRTLPRSAVCMAGDGGGWHFDGSRSLFSWNHRADAVYDERLTRIYTGEWVKLAKLPVAPAR